MVWLSRGQPILPRHVHGGVVRYAIPDTVVEDGEDLVALSLRAGTPLRWTTGLERLTRPGAAPEHRRWHSTDVLVLIGPGAAHATWPRWGAASGAFLGWYVNLQRPLERTDLGSDTWGQALDVVVSPDLEPSRKDEDELAEVQRLGLLSAAEAAAVRAEAAAVIGRIETRQAPFSPDWPSRRPDPRRLLPQMPDGRSRVTSGSS
jgi:hypothetical protein